ncbi:hypothetical protein P879_11158 [Paragonimus westermani]|uniref:Phosphatidylinositol N-acetylglucosaminyltransferase subunit H conserved domain-containing protein n=1 Tax=Paragonimus westermani TaxID=34504 RepID=A0A8T0DAH5_9TREM|nr:hypothetical protein P879_11158 [Paragonimus westermani]
MLSVNELSLVDIQIAMWLLSLDPQFPRGSSERVQEMQTLPPPRWIQVKLKRIPSSCKWIFLFLVGATLIWLLGTLFQSNVIPLFATLLFALFLYIRLRSIIVEECLLVVSGFGIQTQRRFMTGNQLFSTFIPISRLRSVLLVDRVTPITIIPYLAAELSAIRLSSDVCGSQDPPSLQNQLFPLLPSSLTEDGQNFLGSLCLPFPTLVFVFRLIHTVCSPL